MPSAITNCTRRGLRGLEGQMTVKLSKKGMAAVVAGVLAIPASAIIVYDPINEVHHVKNLAESIKIMQQAVTTYNRITDQYNHMKYMAQYLKNMPGRYKAPLTPWKGMSATSTYGTTNRWIAAVNQGIDSMQGWESATLRSVDFAGAFGNIPASQQPRRKAEFATLELQDGAGVSARLKPWVGQRAEGGDHSGQYRSRLARQRC